MLYLTNNIGPTSVGVNTFSTIVLLTRIINCDGGALLATQHTHFCLILYLILREQTTTQCVPYTTRARHCNIVRGLSKCHSFFYNEWHNDMNPAFISTIMGGMFARRAPGALPFY